MKKIEQDELYQNLSSFLKKKGVRLEHGAYASNLREGCGLLADIVNATQETVVQAKSELNRALDQLRQSIHDATAPAPPPPAEPSSQKESSGSAKTSTPLHQDNPKPAPRSPRPRVRQSPKKRPQAAAKAKPPRDLK